MRVPFTRWMAGAATVLLAAAGLTAGATASSATTSNTALTQVPGDVTAQATRVLVLFNGAPGPALSSRIDYQFVVSSATGYQSATAVVDLPAAITNVSALSDGCTYSAAAAQVTCDLGAHAAGDFATGSFRGNVGLLTIGAVNATVNVTATGSDGSTGSDAETAFCEASTSLIIECSGGV